jgi:hypothetical protein
MIVVYFYENKNLLLSQFVKTVPAVGDALTIKGRKGKVTSVNAVDEGKFNVQMALEAVKPKTAVFEDPKKKKR